MPQLATRTLLERTGDFSLASMCLEYPGPELVETLGDLHRHLGEYPALTPLVAEVGRGLPELQGRYSRLFELGKHRVSLYETEHGRMRGAAKGNDLADIAGFYKAFELVLDDSEVHEMLDHLAVELEFCAHLLLRQHYLTDHGDSEGHAIVEDARREFLVSHLGRFVGVIAEQPSVREDQVYGPLLSWCSAIVSQECATLGVTPPPLDFFADRGERDDANCGAVRLPVLP